MDSPPKKINLISCGPMAHVSDIKLIRTDTTLDLSQKAEKDRRSRITGFWLEGGDLAVKIKAMLVMYGLKLLNDCLV
ncbi:hypothetical protein NC652_009521 [Populus alba x Populus x berolinensis]|nr:hypothetical protein NC652_009521 [Populus alba x Populus x berolinensis]